MPVGQVLVGHPAGHVGHDDGALALDVEGVPDGAVLLLAGHVPDVEPDGAAAGVEDQVVHLDAEGGHVLLLQLASKMPLQQNCPKSALNLKYALWWKYFF